MSSDITESVEDTDPTPWQAADLVARLVHAHPTPSETLDAILRTAVEVCSGVVAAGVNLYVRKRFEPQAVFGAAPPELDELQKQQGRGPRIEASDSQQIVIIHDTATDSRWPEFCERAQQLSIGAVLCAPLWIDDVRLGSLSLYATASGEFAPGVLPLATMLSTQAALALADVRRATSLREAIDSRDLIGQAKGILMERHHITAEQAFDMVTAASQSTRFRTQRVAEILTTTGELPASPRQPV